MVTYNMGKKYSTNIQVRYRDIDPLRHVSHTEFLTYMQQARLEFSEEVLGMTGADFDTVVVHVEIDYMDDITTADAVEVGMIVTDLGRTSFTVGYEIEASGSTAATGNSVQVVVDGTTGDSVRVPDEWRAILSDYSS
jgi:acyl-CoA thioester hydrolase